MLLLGLVYLGAVTILQNLFMAASGQSTPLSIVLSTLAIAAMFGPLRRRVQAFIDRRFYRQRYNAEQVLAAFAERARQETDLEVLTADLVEAVQETMQPEWARMWLKPHKGRTG
jgi:ABC-type Fe3+-siderophore transport system permease subunit